jgi:hypothetical protein
MADLTRSGGRLLIQSYARELNGIWVPAAIGVGLLGFFGANALWHLLFVTSGYLSETAVQRMRL